jgi:hypothetical protein
LNTAGASNEADCVLKAGCDTKEPRVAFLQLLKDFVPEAFEKIGFDRSRSVFVIFTDRFLPMDFTSQSFHPPRSF